MIVDGSGERLAKRPPPRAPRLPVWCVAGYPRSFVDAIHTWVAALPFPAWAVYVAAWLFLAATMTALKWLDGTYPVGTIFPFHVVVQGSGVYIIALMHFLDASASRALDTMRPVLDLADEDLACVRFRLTELPARGVIVVYIAGLAFALFQRTVIVAPSIDRYLYAEDGVVMVFETLTIPMFVWPMLFVYFFHTLRQLRLIDELYRRHAHIDLFQTRPLYAFASLAARNAVGLLIIGYAWLAAYPPEVDAGVRGLLLATEGALVGLVLLAFLWPLWGAHARLVQERQRRKEEVHRKLDMALDTLHRNVERGDYAPMDGLTKAIAGLTEEMRLVQAASTWPWSPNTLRAFLTAVLIPMLLWGTQQVLSRTLLG